MFQEVFRQLSTEFQRAWREFGRITFLIEIVAPGFMSTDYPPYDREKYELLAQVCLPLDSSQKITADHENSTVFG